MLQALIHKKLKASFANPSFRPSEDTLTSSVLGLLQYLPSNIFLSILKEACGKSSTFPVENEEVVEVRFWEHWDGNNTTNSRLVEPDIFIVTENYHIIVEAKKKDESGQYVEQWKNELTAHKNSFPNDSHNLILYALGGNESLAEKALNIGKDKVPIYRASWFNLLHAVSKELLDNKHSFAINRLLSDVISAFEFHGFFDMEWLDSLYTCSLNPKTKSVFTDSKLFSRFYTNHKPLNSKYLDIWKI